jgi:hypothetical protein
MKGIDRSSLVLGAALAALTAAAAHAGTGPNAPRVLGYEDPQTGKFHALTKVVPDATTAPTTGTVEVTFNIKLVTTFPKGTTISCGIDVTGNVENTTTFTYIGYYESAASTATISGSTATCSTTVPYSWLLPAASSTESPSFGADYTVTAYPATTTAQTFAIGVYRQSGSSIFESAAIPPSGTVSKYTVNVTL